MKDPLDRENILEAMWDGDNRGLPECEPPPKENPPVIIIPPTYEVPARWGWRQWAAVACYALSGICATLAERLDTAQIPRRPIL